MAATRDTAADTAEKDKGKRRTSFARALHVPNISRRVKQFEQAVSDQALPATPKTPSRPKEAVVDVSRHNNEEPPIPSLAFLETGRGDEDIGGAEIPDIPLRRSSNTINSDFTASSLNSLERILRTGGLQSGPHPGPLNFHPFQVNAENEKRYDDQYHVPDERSLYPLTECSRESSLPDVSETSDEPEPSLRREDSFSSQPPRRDQPMLLSTSLAPRRDISSPIDEHSGHSPVSPVEQRTASPYDREMAPTRLAESRGTSITTRTSFQTFQTDDESSPALPALQTIGVDNPDTLHPVGGDGLDPHSFDLVIPPLGKRVGVYRLEHRSELLFSVEHMRVIISDPILLHRFSSFLGVHRPQRVPLLNYSLEALKAIRAMEYVNDIISRSLRPEGHQMQHYSSEFAAKAAPELTVNESLKQKTAAAFEALAKEDLPAYITHTWSDIAEQSMRRKMTGMMPENLQYLSEGLAEVFCISDPSRKDNPIVFASEEFHRTTQYGPDYVLGRNCRFLQGPKTNAHAVQRIRDAVTQGKEHFETFLNYRRDGLPFMNLLMTVPLLDSMGQIRYFLGAQIDVSGLAKNCSGLESLRKLVEQDEEKQRDQPPSSPSTSPTSDTTTTHHHPPRRHDSGTDLSAASTTIPAGIATTTSSVHDPTRAPPTPDKQQPFRLFAEMFSRTELETVRRFGGRMHRSQQEQGQHLEAIGAWHKQPRMVLHDAYEPSPPSSPPQGFEGQQQQHGGPRHIVSDAHGNINISVPTMTTTTTSTTGPSSAGGISRAPAAFENYLVVRPYPSLNILFASPTLRVPGILQSRLMSRIGGSQRIHTQLEEAFREGRGVTARVKWISAAGALRNVASGGAGGNLASGGGALLHIPDGGASSSGASSTAGTVIGGVGAQDAGVGQEGRPRWIHCTPLMGVDGGVGVWVVLIIDDDDAAAAAERKRAARKQVARQMAPPVAPPMRTMDLDGGGFGRFGRVGGGGSVMDDSSLMDYRMSDEEPRRREGGAVAGWGWEGERDREKGWDERREESLYSDMRLRNEDSQRSEVRVKDHGAEHSKIGTTVASVPGSSFSNNKNSTANLGNGTSSGNGNGTKPREQRREGTVIPTTSSFDRAMGTISSARNMLLSSSKSSSAMETPRQEKEKEKPEKQPLYRGNFNNNNNISNTNKSSSNAKKLVEQK